LFLGIRRLVALIPLPLSGWSCGRLLQCCLDLRGDQFPNLRRAVDVSGYGRRPDVAGRCAGGSGGLGLFGLSQCLASQGRVDHGPDAAGDVAEVLQQGVEGGLDARFYFPVVW